MPPFPFDRIDAFFVNFLVLMAGITLNMTLSWVAMCHFPACWKARLDLLKKWVVLRWTQRGEEKKEKRKETLGMNGCEKTLLSLRQNVALCFWSKQSLIIGCFIRSACRCISPTLLNQCWMIGVIQACWINADNMHGQSGSVFMCSCAWHIM